MKCLFYAVTKNKQNHFKKCISVIITVIIAISVIITLKLMLFSLNPNYRSSRRGVEKVSDGTWSSRFRGGMVFLDENQCFSESSRAALFSISCLFIRFIENLFFKSSLFIENCFANEHNGKRKNETILRKKSCNRQTAHLRNLYLSFSPDFFIN